MRNRSAVPRGGGRPPLPESKRKRPVSSTYDPDLVELINTLHATQLELGIPSSKSALFNEAVRRGISAVAARVLALKNKA